MELDTEHGLWSGEAERSVLSSCMNSERAFVNVTEIINSNDFYFEGNKFLFELVRDCYRKDGTFDLVIACDKLKSTNGSLSNLDLVQIYTHYVTDTNVIKDSELIKEYSLRRQLKQKAQITIQEIEQKDYETLSRNMESWIIELNEKVISKYKPDIVSIISENRKHLKEIKEGRIKTVPVLDRTLEDFLPAYYPRHQIMIGGFTSVGKSTYLMQLVLQMCKADANVIVFSTEDSRQEKLNKLIANISGIPVGALKIGRIDDENALAHAENEIERFKLNIYDDVYGLEEMRFKIRKHQLTGDVDIVCLDYIQNLRVPGHGIYEQMRYAVTELYRMGRELGVCFVICSQVSNESTKVDQDVLGLKGAGELQSTPDMVIKLIRGNKKDNEERQLGVAVRKNRQFGKVGNFKMEFVDKWTRLQKV